MIANHKWQILTANHVCLEGLEATNGDIVFIEEVLYPFVLSLHMRLQLLCTCRHDLTHMKMMALRFAKAPCQGLL